MMSLAFAPNGPQWDRFVPGTGTHRSLRLGHLGKVGPCSYAWAPGNGSGSLACCIGGIALCKRSVRRRVLRIAAASRSLGHVDAPTADLGFAPVCDTAPSRRALVPASLVAGWSAVPAGSSGEPPSANGLVQVADPQTYSALSYTPPGSAGKKRPLLVVLHGAGKNDRDAWDLAELKGEHGGLVPSLLASGKAPLALTDNFAVVAPYSAGSRSFYEEPRGKLIQFVQWVCSDAGRQAGCADVDPKRIFLFGFSDGATAGVELMTTRRFAGGVFAAYGFTGDLPSLAKDRLKDLPMWIFHSADDVIFPVRCSDKLVDVLRKVSRRDVVRYTRYDRDQEGFTGSVRGHSTGITASRQAEIYEWMLSL